jgi:hypothetical protein
MACLNVLALHSIEVTQGGLISGFLLLWKNSEMVTTAKLFANYLFFTLFPPPPRYFTKDKPARARFKT